jgi:hypothetical protein
MGWNGYSGLTQSNLGVELPDKESEVAWGGGSSGGVHLPMSLAGRG